MAKTTFYAMASQWRPNGEDSSDIGVSINGNVLAVSANKNESPSVEIGIEKIFTKEQMNGHLFQTNKSPANTPVIVYISPSKARPFGNRTTDMSAEDEYAFDTDDVMEIKLSYEIVTAEDYKEKYDIDVIEPADRKRVIAFGGNAFAFGIGFCIMFYNCEFKKTPKRVNITLDPMNEDAKQYESQTLVTIATYSDNINGPNISVSGSFAGGVKFMSKSVSTRNENTHELSISTNTLIIDDDPKESPNSQLIRVTGKVTNFIPTQAKDGVVPMHGKMNNMLSKQLTPIEIDGEIGALVLSQKKTKASMLANYCPITMGSKAVIYNAVVSGSRTENIGLLTFGDGTGCIPLDVVSKARTTTALSVIMDSNYNPLNPMLGKMFIRGDIPANFGGAVTIIAEMKGVSITAPQLNTDGGAYASVIRNISVQTPDNIVIKEGVTDEFVTTIVEDRNIYTLTGMNFGLVVKAINGRRVLRVYYLKDLGGKVGGDAVTAHNDFDMADSRTARLFTWLTNMDSLLQAFGGRTASGNPFSPMLIGLMNELSETLNRNKQEKKYLDVVEQAIDTIGDE